MVAIEHVSTVQLFIREAIVWLAKLVSHRRQLMMSKIINKLHSSHMLQTTPTQQKGEEPTESTGVVPAEYPSKVKSEHLQTLECQSLDELCIPCFLMAWGFYSRVGPTFVSWLRRYFLMEKNPNKCTYFVGFFPYKGFLD